MIARSLSPDFFLVCAFQGSMAISRSVSHEYQYASRPCGPKMQVRAGSQEASFRDIARHTVLAALSPAFSSFAPANILLTRPFERRKEVFPLRWRRRLSPVCPQGCREELTGATATWHWQAWNEEWLDTLKEYRTLLLSDSAAGLLWILMDRSHCVSTRLLFCSRQCYGLTSSVLLQFLLVSEIAPPCWASPVDRRVIHAPWRTPGTMHITWHTRSVTANHPCQQGSTCTVTPQPHSLCRLDVYPSSGTSLACVLIRRLECRERTLTCHAGI